MSQLIDEVIGLLKFVGGGWGFEEGFLGLSIRILLHEVTDEILVLRVLLCDEMRFEEREFLEVDGYQQLGIQIMSHTGRYGREDEFLYKNCRAACAFPDKRAPAFLSIAECTCPTRHHNHCNAHLTAQCASNRQNLYCMQ
uniref:AlNc14C147G7427 protein n=1 Tax=Albugo laibachii Nc14 TaxID=890382 RepID=F0WLN9_9STRA|nr:AlNc14C147G7427 [Albugo laibachii Nc14]|eukprot:CCA22205.1 AlNc14C147G7427 [Albugo laibachii Nc14]